jgi:hypothetical protein
MTEPISVRLLRSVRDSEDVALQHRSAVPLYMCRLAHLCSARSCIELPSIGERLKGSNSTIHSHPSRPCSIWKRQTPPTQMADPLHSTRHMLTT